MKRYTEKRKNGQRGFTLIELLIVIVILGLLVGLVGPRMFGRVSTAMQTTAKAQISLLCTAVDTFRLDMGRYPESLDELVKKVDDRRWKGPYLPGQLPLDPWGNPYIYRVPGEGGRDYDIMSYGANGVPGGEGEDEDIVSWRALGQEDS